MKRLFECAGGFFEHKTAAKAHRDAVGAGAKKLPKVHIGPDHWRFGLKGHPRTHSHKLNSGGSGNGFPNRRK